MRKMMILAAVFGAMVFSAVAAHPADTDKDGKISLNEFLELKKKQLTGTDRAFDEEYMKDLFNKKDLDKDGFLSIEEIQAKPVKG